MGKKHRPRQYCMGTVTQPRSRLIARHATSRPSHLHHVEIPVPFSSGQRLRKLRYHYSGFIPPIITSNSCHRRLAVTHALLVKDLRWGPVGSGKKYNSRDRRGIPESCAASPRAETGLRAIEVNEEELWERRKTIPPVRSMMTALKQREKKVGVRWCWSGMVGFVLTTYMMLFLLLCNTELTMIVPGCSKTNPPLQIWIEMDSRGFLCTLLCHWVWAHLMAIQGFLFSSPQAERGDRVHI
ncbi:unnamed protein product [Tuber aestivum]|uniref:Uncharacterized protein n=1 Tax=Tuber aestivum TaxID=59557 RepID=A0A292PJF7_9PEZI|nr:unnamed protein product [Tuber aestivum]